MRYALYHGRYEHAARLAQEVMESGRYELYPNYGDLFQYAGASSNKEFIQHHKLEGVGANNTWSLLYSGPHFRTGHGQSYSVPTKALVDAYWTLQGPPINDCARHSKAEYELNPKLNGDHRYQVSIMG